ncbi:hypothetical protein BAE44_0015119 [Dichanthelium oligosanthes]|uniref:NAD(P)-binding domain-containing protein n=1 Tax=Dichanthelium oligosanthes TaxID=888268 RepID=A0A1E5VFH9_9POAL|nr:hypothetical protein BAE44_0015119 [Dichanthelium oligosanthes]
MAPPPRVCVTGGGGFIASWLVKLLLSRGYAVHATLRDPADPKNAHLKEMDKAPENLHLFKADVLDHDTLTSAVEGCEGSEVLDPAVKGGPDVMNNRLWHIVDVRDVADALLLLYEKKESSGRYICSPNHICTKDLVALLKKMYPNILDVDHKASLTCQKLMDLGWEPRTLEETLSDSVECYEKAGVLRDVPGHPCRLPHLFRLAGDQ